MTTIDIFIADDHNIMRSGLRQLLSSVSDLRVVGEAPDGKTLLDSLPQHRVHVVLMDLSMPGLSGVDLIRQLQAQAPELPILVLSMHVEAQIVARVLRAGAAGYVTKDCDASVLVDAVRKVAAGGHYIDPTLVDSVVFQAPSATEACLPHDQLSPRERQVLERVSAGMALGQIADELHLSPKTVSTHKMRLMQKLDLHTNADLLKYAVRHGLTSN